MTLARLGLLMVVLFLTGCATEGVKDSDYIKAMHRQDEETFQRYMQNY